MDICKNLPLDIVKEILAYDARFVIRNGMISQRLDKKKYADIRNKLISMPKKSIKYNADTKHFWAWVEFDKYMIKYYNDEVDIDYIRYEFRRKFRRIVVSCSGKNIRYLVNNKMVI